MALDILSEAKLLLKSLKEDPSKINEIAKSLGLPTPAAPAKGGFSGGGGGGAAPDEPANFSTSGKDTPSGKDATTEAMKSEYNPAVKPVRALAMEKWEPRFHKSNPGTAPMNLAGPAPAP